MPRLIDHDERRNHIIDVTWDLIVEGGIEAATMREIAAKAGFANGALKHYFASKDMIVESTFQRAMSMIEGYSAVTDTARGVEALRQLCLATLPLDEKRVTAGRVLLTYWEMSLSNEHMRSVYSDFLGNWRGKLAEYIAQGREDGDIVTSTPDDELVDELVLLTAGAQVMTLAGPQYTSIDMVRRHLDTFMERLTKR